MRLKPWSVRFLQLALLNLRLSMNITVRNEAANCIKSAISTAQKCHPKENASLQQIVLASYCKFLLRCDYTVIVASKSYGNEKEDQNTPC